MATVTTVAVGRKRHRLAARQEGAWLVLGLIAMVALLVMPPMIFLLLGSLRSTLPDGSAGALTLMNYANVIFTRALASSAINSAVFASGSAALALVLGGGQAWLVERTNTAFKGLATLGAIMSLAIPYILYVIAALFAFGRLGPVNALGKSLFGVSLMPQTLNSLGGMVFIEGLLWTPLVFLMLAPVFRAGNPVLEEAALASGAGQFTTLFQITFRLAKPAILAVLLLVFIKGLEAFEVPALVGLPGGVSVLTTEVYLHLKMSMPPDLGHASAFAVLLIMVIAVLLRWYQRVLQQAERYRTIVGKAFRPRLIDLGWKRWLGGGFLVLNFTICVALPLLSLAWASMMPFYQAVSMRGFARMTWKNYETVFHLSDLSAVGNTLALAVMTASVAMALSTVSGWTIARGRRHAKLLDQLGSVPLVVPGIVLAVAIMQQFLAVPLPIYGTIWILLIAFVIRYLPYGLRYATAGFVQVDPELEEAAATSGAGGATRFLRVALPLVGPAVGSGWLFILLLVARDLSLPVLLTSPSSQVVAVHFFDLWQNGQAPELAAYGMVWTGLMSVVALAFYLVTRRFGGAIPATE